MSANFDLSNFALQAACPGNELLYDDLGMPSVMVYVPKLTYAQLGMGESTAVHPAFLVNGVEVDGLYLSQYPNVVQNGRAYSLPGTAPRNAASFETARTACESKGAGWHLMTRMEWGLLVRWCQNNGVMPKGNNDYGKHNTETSYQAIPATRDDTHYALTTLTGTGPLTWYHNQEPTGIADLCGNVWELCGGIRTVCGEIQILPNNNAADASRSQSDTSTEWKAIRASDGTMITPDGTGTTNGSVKMDWSNAKLTYHTTRTDTEPGAHGGTFANIVCSTAIGAEARLLLQNLGLLQYGDTSELFASQVTYFNNAEPEQLFVSGGNCTYSTYGLATFNARTTRTATSFGFRAAYVKLPTA